MQIHFFHLVQPDIVRHGLFLSQQRIPIDSDMILVWITVLHFGKERNTKSTKTIWFYNKHKNRTRQITMMRWNSPTSHVSGNHVIHSLGFTFPLLTLWLEWGRSTQTSSSLLWHSVTVAATGQAGSHHSSPSRGWKLIPDHSSSRPVGAWRHSHFMTAPWHRSRLSGDGGNPGDSRSLKGQTWTLLASVTADHPCCTSGRQCQRVLFVTELLQANNWRRNCTSMQRQGRGLEYWSNAFLTGSSFLI